MAGSGPTSVTARIGEAASLIHFAWNARGSAYADTVTPEAWALFGQRLAEAARLLNATLRDSPEWYAQMLTVALA